MLFGETDGGEAGWYALIGVILTAVVGGISSVLTIWWKQRKEQRADVLSEWRDLVDRQQVEIGEIRNEVRTLQVDHARCLVENAEIKGELRQQQSALRRLQTLAGDEAPSTVLPAQVIANLDGKILDVTTPITPILHWLVKDLRGQNVEVLVPPRLLDKHRAGIQGVRASGVMPWTEKSIITYAREKGGGEVPVTLTLYGWQDKAGDWLVSVEIKLRAGGESGILSKAQT